MYNAVIHASNYTLLTCTALFSDICNLNPMQVDSCKCSIPQHHKNRNSITYDLVSHDYMINALLFTIISSCYSERLQTFGKHVTSCKVG